MRHAAAFLALVLASAPLAAQPSDSTSRTPETGTRGGVQLLPSGDLYEPSLADPREPRFHQSVVQVSGGSVASRVWLADHGESIGLVRWTYQRDRALQVGVLVAKFAQFDLFTESNDLLNADYMIGFPVTFQRGRTSGRISLYHVSSHLGDEYLVRTGDERVNVSYETLDIRLVRELRGIRLYGGAEAAIRRSPSDLNAAAIRLGAESRLALTAFNARRGSRVQPVLSVDLAVPTSAGRVLRASAKGGVELATRRSLADGGRRLAIVGEFYSGNAQFGQFYRERIRYTGLAVQFTL